MKKAIFLAFMLFPFCTLFAQGNTQLFGVWQLVTTIGTLPNGSKHSNDSAHYTQIKIFTPDHQFMVFAQSKINGKERFNFSAGGHYTLQDNNCIEKTEYASYSGYELVKVNYTIKIDGNKMVQKGSVTHQNRVKTLFEGNYVRKK